MFLFSSLYLFFFPNCAVFCHFHLKHKKKKVQKIKNLFEARHKNKIASKKHNKAKKWQNLGAVLLVKFYSLAWRGVRVSLGKNLSKMLFDLVEIGICPIKLFFGLLLYLKSLYKLFYCLLLLDSKERVSRFWLF